MSLALGIETSCDETACAIVRNGREVLSSVVWSQHTLHEEYGGVVPEIASRAHVERIYDVAAKSCHAAATSISHISVVTVGNRPGLIGSLVVGVSTAKAIAWALNKPLKGVDHVRAHLIASFLTSVDETGADWRSHAPALGLVVSGGHTSIYDWQSPSDAHEIGRTIDDAVGEAYDKVGAMLGLPHPAGPALDALAVTGNARAYDFPVSRLDPASLDFSFSGLKTAALYAIRGLPGPGGVFERDHTALSQAEKADIAASFQRAASRAVILKLERALDTQAPRARSIIVGGGVSANSRLRQELLDLGCRKGLHVGLPKMEYCVDNAAMIAAQGWWEWQAGCEDGLTLRAQPTLSSARGR
ncbi:MAG: tRNA (adenosine(37)-N6)-threonylcarbamoyltransferase complex transferase subunit TsaD [Phycisphaerales bacterium]